MKELAASQGILDQPGTVAFLVIFGMGVILFFVFRSMSRHLRKIQLAARAEEEAAARAKAAEGDAGAGYGIEGAGFGADGGAESGTDAGAVTGFEAGPGGRRN